MASLILLAGFAGAGKSTLARRLAREKNWPLFSSDDFIAGVRLATKESFHEAAPMAHELMWYVVGKQVEHGTSVIVDTNMCHARSWQNLDALWKRFPRLRVVPIVLECPLPVHKQRVESRGRNEPAHLNLGGDNFEDVLHKYAFIQTLERPDLIRINADGEAEDVYADILRSLDKHCLMAKNQDGSHLNND